MGNKRCGHPSRRGEDAAPQDEVLLQKKSQPRCRIGLGLFVLRANATKPEEIPMSKIAPCLWFADEAEEAAKFYVSLLPDSRIDKVQRSPIDTPSGKAGSVLVVQFTLAGQEYMALNGGVRLEYTNAISFKIDCADQAEVDRLWEGLTAGGGAPSQCGWLKDRYGVSWQIVPSAMMQFLGGSDRAGAQRAMAAMMKMGKLDIAMLQKAYDGG
jgi:predicted 3-demethylubiquinone-9 3-methyltransferase (glyoxalase superfamily)